MPLEDQNDILAQLTSATAALKGANATVESQKATITALQNQLETEQDAHTKERDGLKAKVAELEAKQNDFDKSVAAKVASLGISGEAGKQTEAGGEKAKAPTYTERVLKANGVTSLEALHEKRKAQREALAIA